ncbi:MAG TPA: EAL domain-containing protein [Aurantimonas coralicida]|uniref:EAL domain-containing protein n=2 Tax=root TaxID=1 RepID=A0A9C9NDU2_9HYPH|nr:EAL domain-containing protein [Aurantimonas coralicida]HET99439.1 EAL domain-containing protein [Aurantimonas coralicida]
MKSRLISGWVNNLPIGVKAFGGGAVLLISLLSIGALAIAAFGTVTFRLENFATSAIAKQTTQEELIDVVSAAHLDLFRYIAWASNGVNDLRLDKLRIQIAQEGEAAKVLAADLAKRDDLTSAESQAALMFAESWKKYVDAARETVDVGSVDPAMGTMLLGGSDDDFQRAATQLRRLTAAAHLQTRRIVDELLTHAARNGRAIEIGGVVALFACLGILFIFVRSIVIPVRSVTHAMRKISFGNLEFRPSSADSCRRDEIGQMVSAIVTFCGRMRDAKAVIERNEQELLSQNQRFDAALANMSQGLCMFDGDKRLIVSNARFAEIYGIDPEVMKPGTHFHDIELRRIDTGGYVGIDTEEYLGEHRDSTGERGSHVKVQQLKDGRSLAIYHRPMPGGGWLTTHDDITNIRRIEAQIAHMAHHDGLTDLPNRTLFAQTLDAAFEARSEHQQVAVFCLDIDRFKSVNDTLGHPTGDLLLKIASARLTDCVRATGTAARLSGDEFAIIVPAVRKREEMEALAERIVDAMAQPFDIEGHQICVSASVGIALSKSASGTAEELVRNADTALYRAKAEGRSVFRFFKSGMDAGLQRRRQLEMDLRLAIREGQMELHFQPIIDLASDRVVAFEALLRWTHPLHGPIPPSEFIPIAEDVGYIEPMGEWVIRQACLAAALWPDEIHVAINLSPLQFGKHDLVATVTGALADAGIAPSRIELEVTESVLLHDSDANLKTLQDLRDLGARIVMDDFGTGYASLSYLRSFPFDKIKIDRCFVKDVATNAESGAIVKAVIDLAASLGMTTTAEGVECPEQLDYLRSQGCSEAQGFLYSAARPAEELPALLARLTMETMRRRVGADREVSSIPASVTDRRWRADGA